MAKRERHAILAEKASVFQRFFDSPDGLEVLAELKAFCFLNDTTIAISGVTGVVDQALTIRNEGRRQVLVFIMKHAGLTFSDLERIRSIDEIEAQRDVENAVFGS